MPMSFSGTPAPLPVGDEIYGYPPALAEAFEPDRGSAGRPAAHAAGRCGTSSPTSGTPRWQFSPRRLFRPPTRSPSTQIWCCSTTRRSCTTRRGQACCARTPFWVPRCGASSSRRTSPRGCDADPGTPLVYVSFGSFLSVRADVLAKVVDALRPLPVRVALAIGSADPAVVGDVPSGWLVREFLPQVALLERAALAVTHGGNNSVTESLTCGVPMLVLPFSTDQFAGAAAVENAGVGEVLDPNAVTVAELRSTLNSILQGNHGVLAAEIGAALRARPGREVAKESMVLATA